MRNYLCLFGPAHGYHAMEDCGSGPRSTIRFPVRNVEPISFEPTAPKVYEAEIITYTRRNLVVYIPDTMDDKQASAALVHGLDNPPPRRADWQYGDSL